MWIYCNHVLSLWNATGGGKRFKRGRFLSEPPSSPRCFQGARSSLTSASAEALTQRDRREPTWAELIRKVWRAGSSTNAGSVLMFIWKGVHHRFFSFSAFTADLELLRVEIKHPWINKAAWGSHLNISFCLVIIFNLDNRGSINHCLVFKSRGWHKCLAE